MGKSTSCFKLITCGGDSAGKDAAVDVTESKRSSDRKGWSFRKRSERHRVLSNTVIQEATSGGLKESQESAGFEFQQPDVSVSPNKTSTVQFTEEKPQLITPKEYIEERSEFVVPKEYDEEKSHSVMPIDVAEEKSQLLTPIKCSEENSQPLTPEEPKVTEPVSATTNEAEDDSTPDESLAVTIQTAIRGILARKELEKLRNLVKLQAAVRGHLVRRHAVGTLRCVQAIVKMQLLVRARLSQKGSYAEKKPDGKGQDDNQRLGSSATKKNSSYNSMEKLLSNRFARQIMDSTPKTKPIHIKCDVSKPNSAWSWLERWMSVSSSEKSSRAELPIEQPEQTKSHDCDSPLTAAVPPEVIVSNEPDVGETLVSSESEENLITYDAANFNFEAHQPASSTVTDDLEQHQIDHVSTSDLKETSLEMNSQGKTMQTDAHSPIEVSCLSNKPEMESEQPKHSMKRSASEQLEKEAKKSVFGSRKAGNPAFIAAQTKFELSSTAKPRRSIDSSHQDVKVESNLDTVSSGTDMISGSKEPSFAENPVLSNWKIHHGGSECGTELSITSTLDSPDTSEVGTLENENGAKVLEQENRSSNSLKDLDVKGNDTVEMPVPDSSLSVADQPEKLEGSKAGSTNSIVVDSPQIEQEPLESTAYLQREQDSINQAYRSSPEVSPRSHMTVPESQGTPSSEVSVNPKKKKAGKSSQKRKSLSAAKCSPSTPVASGVEQLPKDQKNSKRCNSFSSTRPENIDEEPRDSNSSNYVPRFMQATESARAKLNANNSPRSSPDVQDREISIKKRHSLPATNGRQGSPRIQRSLSQTQQAAKGNGSNPVPERRWQR
ncbi:protein IQ-DOMAIN 32-like isoform X2 [Hibiscus syriacus]|uniref:protein IQ-DOMAIN 32-like isoform X2 n=1 Tax=Hibiscus syriacus TaxID=106335 RepID=UPI00192208AE|nr:protein IQ-DOMAIN 32-like isoform X2 [Hibiscus syriacus]